MNIRFIINKKRIAKEIILFWFILVPITIVLVYVTTCNSIYNNKIAVQEDIIQDYQQDYQQVKNELSEIADISIVSVNKKLESQYVVIDRQTFFEINYPEFQHYFSHDPENILPNLKVYTTISSEYSNSIIENSSFWDDYIKNLYFIYYREKTALDKQTHVQNKHDFEKRIKTLYTKAFNILNYQIEISKSKLNENKSKIISPKQRNNIIFFLVICYLVLIYPVRLLIISIIWSIKTLKK